MAELPTDDNYKAAIGGYDPSGHQVVALEAVSVTTDSTTNIKYGVLQSNASFSASSTGAKTNVSASASSVTILASNTSRKGAMIYNDSTALLYLDLSGGTASSSSYSVQVPANGFFEVPGPAIYTGAITGIWASATGNARVTEFS